MQGCAWSPRPVSDSYFMVKGGFQQLPEGDGAQMGPERFLPDTLGCCPPRQWDNGDLQVRISSSGGSA